MNFSQVCLAMIGKLHSKATSDFNLNQNPVNLIPARIIQSLIDRLELCKAEFSLNAVESKSLLKMKFIGKFCDKSELRKYAFKVNYFLRNNPPRHQNIFVGELLVYSSVEVLKSDFNALATFTNMLGEHIGAQLYAAAQYRTKLVYKQIKTDINLLHKNTGVLSGIYDDEILDVRERRKATIKRSDAGSLIHYLVRQVHNASKCFAVYFGILQGDKLYIDYGLYKKGYNENIIQKHRWHSLSSPFNTLLSDSSIILQPLNSVFPSLEVDKKWQALILVIKNDEVPISLFILQLNSEKAFFYNPVKDLLEYIRGADYSEFKYLYQRRTGSLIVNPIFNSRETRVDLSKVFVIMPFTESWSKRIWEKFIKPTVEKLGLSAERADDLYGKDIMEDIWKGILSSRVVIADITGRNPNVLYELGVVHAIGKDFVMITQNMKDIPFDLNRYRCIHYEDNADGYEKLEKELLRHLATKIGV